MRASAGSVFRVRFAHDLDAAETRAALESRQIHTYITVPHPGTFVAPGLNLRRRCALVIGSEGSGVSEPLRAGAPTISIQTACVESLNAAVAAGILLYEALRQRSES